MTTNQTMTLEEQIAALRAENEALKVAKEKHADGLLSLKVSAKGAVSIYGLTKQWPVTLYGTQLSKLFSPEMVAKVNNFALDNIGRLAFVKLEKTGETVDSEGKKVETFRSPTPEETAKGEETRAAVKTALEHNLGK